MKGPHCQHFEPDRGGAHGVELQLPADGASRLLGVAAEASVSRVSALGR